METPKTVAAWARDTFGQASTHANIAARANVEMAELLTALTADDQHPKTAEEIADIFICLYRLIDSLGVDIQVEIDRKMTINRARKWALDGTGHGYHVKG